MNLWELLFLAFVLITLLAIAAAILALVRGRRLAAARLGFRFAIAWLVYFGAVTLASGVLPQKVYHLGEDMCFDEICFAVTQAQEILRADAPRESASFAVSIRVSNDSRGRTQAESWLQPVLWSNGRPQAPSAQRQREWDARHENSPLTRRIAPGESYISVQLFDLPREGHPTQLSFDHGLTPEYLVLGESPLMRPPKIIELAQPR
jgi:hypothetical protein